MGPAYLIDVVGMDIALHAGQVMSQAYERMHTTGPSPIQVLFENHCLGQKSGAGFYRYETDARGKPRKLERPETELLLQRVIKERLELSDEAIIERMMFPLCLETVRCLEEGIVASAAEADMALVMGIGFPPFRGGALRYMEQLGLTQFCQRGAELETQGAIYRLTEGLKAMAKRGETFYPA
jgi:3-hydroxyacyl-CoA dehydrogenase/enoyl-CoA hydratase/3-hydroxybutyryl-CoA epimerase/enoyl-CoA isomerase